MGAGVTYKMLDKLRGESNLFPVGKGVGYIYDSVMVSTAITLVKKTNTELGFTPKGNFLIGIDNASSYFYETEKQRYQVKKCVYKGATKIIPYHIDIATQHKTISIINDEISDFDHGRSIKMKWSDGIFLHPGQE